MRKIEHTHHAENQGQAGAEHEQQEPIAHAVEQRDGEKLKIHRKTSITVKA
ncbi:hypothetical protein D3C71_2133270 [compost metagenome]